MKIWLTWVFIGFSAHAEIELMVIGDSHQPTYFVALPFTYQGDGFSPAVTVENHIIEALSSTGLFSRPYRYDEPADISNMLAWQLAGIRYVLQGEIFEVENDLQLILTISDTLGLQPTLSRVVLNPKQLELSSQIFADQVYRSLFYATFTNDVEQQYLEQENPTLTRYLNQLVVQFKSAWHSEPASKSSGQCTVEIQQLPGGVPFKSQLNEDCFQEPKLAAEIQSALDRVDVLPYEKYQSVFEKKLKLQFFSVD